MEYGNKNILPKDFSFHTDDKLDANTKHVYSITYIYSKDINYHSIQSHIYLDYYNIYIYIRNRNLNFAHTFRNICRLLFVLERITRCVF